MNKNDAILFEEHSALGDHMPQLTGEIAIYRRNKNTGETVFHQKSKNVISISGYQWIMMKMFNLRLDSPHGDGTDPEDDGRDSTIKIPDLNNDNQLGIGVNPTSYSSMEENIASNHFIQGFMVGNGGAAEDAITAKNTNYSFTKLRNPIPFREVTSLESLTPKEANKYLGVYRPSTAGNVNAYYIKKFDETPHIVHSWWKDNTPWDYIDPVTENDLGPNSSNGQGKSNRIETYVEAHLSIDENDCAAYFNHDGNTNTSYINELGLVAYDTIQGSLSVMKTLYDYKVKKFIKLVYSSETYTDEQLMAINVIANEIKDVLYNIIPTTTESHMIAFKNTLDRFQPYEYGSVDMNVVKQELHDTANINVEPYFDIDHSFMYSTDKFEDYAFSAASTTTDMNVTDEAQRIKLITYYTFNSLPIQNDWEILIYYRIYAN